MLFVYNFFLEILQLSKIKNYLNFYSKIYLGKMNPNKRLMHFFCLFNYAELENKQTLYFLFARHVTLGCVLDP